MDMQNNNQDFLLLGSNVEPREATIDMAKSLITKRLGEIMKQSSLYESEPWGFEADTNFLNQVVVINTVLSAFEILDLVKEIEKELGRAHKTTNVYTSRTIDIDLLYCGNEIIVSDELTIPHFNLHERRFTLIPLVEIASDFVHPAFQENQQFLLDHCKDAGKVWLYQKQT